MLDGNEKNAVPNSDDDIEFEQTASEVEDLDLEDIEEKSLDKLKQLREKLKASEAAKMEHLEELQRTKADFLNSKRRLEEQLQSDRARIGRNFIEDLLPLCDSFEMAMSDTDAWEAADEKWRKGIEGIHAQLRNILKTHNVTTIDATGTAFNPHEHEAVGNETGEPDQVLRVIQSGYKQNEVVVRPAKVIVGIN